MDNRWLIIADGERLSHTRLQQLACGRRVLACDGAGLSCLEHGIVPELLLGDLDTIDDESLHALQQQGSSVVHVPDQNKSDTEKGILHALEYGAKDITLCQAMGNRTDHTLLNLRLLRRYHISAAKLRIAREYETVFFVQDETIRFHDEQGSAVAILGFEEAQATSKGLKYELTETKLGANWLDSTSNCIVTKEAVIRIQGEALITKGLGY